MPSSISYSPATTSAPFQLFRRVGPPRGLSHQPKRLAIPGMTTLSVVTQITLPRKVESHAGTPLEKVGSNGDCRESKSVM
ncbi:hypothetical protein BH10PLA2_BH10PLA2_32450 [soil metagenome]